MHACVAGVSGLFVLFCLRIFWGKNVVVGGGGMVGLKRTE